MPLFYFRTRFSLEHKKENQCAKIGNQNIYENRVLGERAGLDVVQSGSYVLTPVFLILLQEYKEHYFFAPSMNLVV
ncbi:MAG: hypothetical protein RL077_1047 [Verrucomicrobiota bacterium]|jgi:hypothetical protein